MSWKTTACCLLFSIPLAAQDSVVSRGFDHFYNLEYDQAIADFTTATQQRPDDPSAWNHLAQAILYRAMFRSGALESQLVSGSNPFLRRAKVQTTPAEDKSFDDAIAKAMELSERRLEQSPDDPKALSALGIAYGLRSNYNFLVHKAWIDALRDATKARNTDKRLCDSGELDACLIPAVFDYVAGSLPLGYRLLSFMAGIHGNRERGIAMLERVAREGKTDRVDAKVLLAAIYRREHRPKDAIPLLEGLIRQYPRAYLLRFEIVQMYSDLGDKQGALAELGRIWDLHRSGSPGYAQLAPEKVDYLEGNFLFWYNDLDQALDYMKKATAKSAELDFNTGIMSWMRLGQIYDLKGDRADAITAYKQAVAMAPQSEVGRESSRYLGKPYKRQEAN